MRFSLGTFVLVILFISSLYAVIALHSPWPLVRTDTYDSIDAFDEYYGPLKPEGFSPDGTRRLLFTGKYDEQLARVGGTITLHEGAERELGKELYVFPNAHAQKGVFVSNDEVHIWCGLDTRAQNFHVVAQVYRKQTFLGYITRPEFIMMLLTLGALVYIGIRNFRTRASRNVAHPPSES